jgi:hypothetical protein
MSSELTPTQQLLLWHLALRGGKSFQPDVEYKTIRKDRDELVGRKLLAVDKNHRPFALELLEDGWDELTKRGSVLAKGKKPSRDRAVLQLLLDALHGYAAKEAIGIGEIIRSKPPASQPSDVQQRIRHAFFEIAGDPPQDSVRLSALRAKLHDVSRQQLDETLIAMKRARKINLMNLDNPRDISSEESSALRDGSQQYHVLWIER